MILMDHANVLQTGKETLSVLYTVVLVMLDVHSSVEEIYAPDLKHQTVIPVSHMLIVTSTESVYVTRAGADTTARATRVYATPLVQPATDQKLMTVIPAKTTLL